MMEWNMKEASWDLGELDEATGLPNIETINDDGSSRFGSDDRRITGEFCVDLKLGQVGNSSCSNEPATVAKWKDVVGGVSKVMMTTPSSSSFSSSGSSKRARALNNGGSQPVSCLVDGCNSDLSNCRDYHRRHKVCELHSKTPVVTIGGHKQRFCQQCSRFHSLEEFDEGKRSCRKRLDGHNRRRRKPPLQQQPAEGVGRCESFLSTYQQGTHLLPFSGSHMYPSTAMAHPAWNSDVRLHHHHHQNQQLHQLADHKEDLFLGSLSSPTYTEASNNNNRLQLAFLQGDHNSTTMENNQRNNDQEALPPPASVCQTFLRAATPPLPAATLHVDHHDSHCALSLLSSPQTHTSGNGLSQMVQPHHHQHQHQQALSSVMQQQQQQQHHHHQALGLSLHDHGLETADSVMVHHGSDHSSTTMYNMNEAPPFPFHWE